MKKTADHMIAQFNLILANHGQLTRIVEWSGDSILLSNGTVLDKDSKRLFCRRITNKITDVWVKNIDDILNGSVLVEDLKFAGRSKGGKAVWEKSKDILKEKFKKRIPHNKGVTGKYKLGARSQEVKDKISAKNSGENNGMHGIKLSDAAKTHKSKLMRELILQGKFTPNSNNRNTHWNATFNDKKYRSSWEALFQYINPTAEYETLRIEYYIDNSTKIYIVDFVDHLNKIAVEVKPRELCVGPKFEAKQAALQHWALSRGYLVLIVDAQWLQSQTIAIDYSKFDKNTAHKIQVLYETNKKN